MIDPEYAANRLPLVEWSRMAFTEDDHYLRAAAFAARWPIVGQALDPWAHVCGPASAVVATLARIEWLPLDHNRWMDHAGRVIDLTVVPPSRVADLVDKATNRILWCRLCASHPQLEDLGGAAWIGPIREVVLGKNRRRGAVAPAL